MNEITKAELLNLTIQLAAGILAGSDEHVWKNEMKDVLVAANEGVHELRRGLGIKIK